MFLHRALVNGDHTSASVLRSEIEVFRCVVLTHLMLTMQTHIRAIRSKVRHTFGQY